MKKIIMVLVIAGFAVLCRAQNPDMEKEKAGLIKADIDFSNISGAKGAHYAFLERFAEDGVLLRDNSYPVTGRQAIKKLYSESSDTGYTLTWKPSYAEVSRSFDLGFTYGIWEMKRVTKNGKSETERGTYATFWRKDKNGEWKMALDTGNNGLEPKKAP